MEIIYPVPERLPLNNARFIQIFNTCYSLAKLGIKVFICCAVKKGYTFQDLLDWYGIPSHPNLKSKFFLLGFHSSKVPIKFTWHFLYNTSLLWHLLHTKKKTKKILFLRYPKLAYFLLKFKNLLNSKFVYEAHEIFFLKNFKYFKIEKRVFNNSDIIICITENLKRFIIKTFKVEERKIFVIPDGVRDEWLEIKRDQGEYIFYAGTLERWKGIEVLIKAMKYLPEEKLIIAGEGRELENLKKLVKELNLEEKIKFLGYIPHKEIPCYLSKSKIGILANIKENISRFTSPLRLFEYMALGLPILATDLPVFKEILIHGENAWLVKPGDPVALAEGIKFLLENPEIAENLASKAKKMANNYTFFERAKRIKEIIENFQKF